jgi:hypothetical protein
MAWQVASMPPNTHFRRVGFKVFSQWDEDGIIQYLINKLSICNETFIEFGVENYEESNTRFLLMNNNWRGMVLDAYQPYIDSIRSGEMYWQYDLQAKTAWITRDNVDALLVSSGFSPDLGLLSIDIDGNDFWIWEAIHTMRPRIVIVEYNSLFGLHPISVPYKEDFNRSTAHYSNLYYGCSLGALHWLAEKKGYFLLGSNVWGHNAFFVRADIAEDLRPLQLQEAYVESKFRESRGPSGELAYLGGTDRIKPIAHLPVVNVETGGQQCLGDFFDVQ